MKGEDDRASVTISLQVLDIELYFTRDTFRNVSLFATGNDISFEVN